MSDSPRRPVKPTHRGVAPGSIETPATFADAPPTQIESPRGVRAKGVVDARTLVDPPRTLVDPPRERLDTPPPLAPPPRPPLKVQSAKSPGSSQPLQVISMKTPAELDAAARVQPVKEHRVEIRDLSKLRQHHATPPQGLGHLAPPRDERQARARKRQDLLIYGSLAVIVASFVTLGIWFLAR